MIRLLSENACIVSANNTCGSFLSWFIFLRQSHTSAQFHVRATDNVCSPRQKTVECNSILKSDICASRYTQQTMVGFRKKKYYSRICRQIECVKNRMFWNIFKKIGRRRSGRRGVATRKLFEFSPRQWQ